MSRIVESVFNEIAVGFIHAILSAAPKEREHARIVMALTQTADQVVERCLVLGEDEQTLIIAPFALRAQ